MVDVDYANGVQKPQPSHWPGEVNLSFWEGFSHHRAGHNNALRNTFRYQNLGRSKSFSGAQPSTSESGSSTDDDDNNLSEADRRAAHLLKTTQLIYDEEGGRMVPRLKAPRQLYGFTGNDLGPQQLTFWPAEVQVATERIVHVPYIPANREPLYESTGREKTPLANSHEGRGRVVFSYEPADQGFFVRSRVGGARIGCVQAVVKLESADDTTLLFESRFESGNLAKSVQISEFEYELWLRTDLYTNRHTQWYYFALSNTRADVTYRFTIVNFMKPDSLYNNGMRPLMYSEKRASATGVGWTRLGSDIKYYRNNVKYSTGKSDRWCYSLTWTFSLPHSNDTVYFAYCYPYTYSDLRDYLNDIANDPIKGVLCKRRLLCRSLAGNAIYLLTITAPVLDPEQYKKRKAVVMTARVHPGETNASWMMKGFLDFLLGQSSEAQLLRSSFVFKVVPMLNPDGVVIGNYRCSLSGRDLNRNYKTVLKNVFPSIYHTRNMIKSLKEERDIIVYCDLHGHSRKEDVFIYGCENNGVPDKRLRERIFPMMLSKNAPHLFSYKGCKFKVQKHKEGTGRVVMWRLGVANSYTMEATFCGSSSGKLKGVHYTTADFEAMGYHFCDTLLDYCDPDPSKYNAVLAELEEKLRADILHMLRVKEGATCDKALSDIDLDEEYDLSEVESSDGGSDSSASDGPPVQLQIQLNRKGTQMERKKVKKSKKERDRLKSAIDITDTKKLRDVTIDKQPVKAKPAPVKAVAPTPITRRPKSQTVVNANATVDNSAVLPGTVVTKGGQQYLETLASTYTRTNTADARSAKSREVVAVPSVATQQPTLPLISTPLPLPLGVLCPRHEHVLVSELLARHLQQYRFPDDIQDVIAAREQQQQAERRLASASHSADIDRQRQRLASAARRRHEELLRAEEEKLAGSGQRMRDEMVRSMELDHFRAREVDVNSGLLIKQHPPPFDERLEKERSGDWVKAVPTPLVTMTSSTLQPLCNPILAPLPSSVTIATADNSAPSSQASQPVVNDRVDTAGVNGRVDTGGEETLPSSSRLHVRRVSDSLNDLDNRTALVPHTVSVGGSFGTRATQRIFRKVPADMNVRRASANDLGQGQTSVRPASSTEPVNHRNTASRVTSFSAKRQVTSSASPVSDIQNTFRAIKQIQDDLLDPAKRGSLSPTTGNFVEHIVHKTDVKVNALREQLQEHLTRKDGDKDADASVLRRTVSSREMRLPLVEEEIFVTGTGAAATATVAPSDTAASRPADRLTDRDRVTKPFVTSPTKISLVMSKSHGGPGQSGEGLMGNGGGAMLNGIPAAPGTGHFHAYPLMVPGNKLRASPLTRAIPHRR